MMTGRALYSMGAAFWKDLSCLVGDSEVFFTYCDKQELLQSYVSRNVGLCDTD